MRNFYLLAALVANCGIVLSQALPQGLDQLGGFASKGERLYYDRGNLYDYINGASDFYLGYAFQDLWVLDYEDADSAKMSVELYCLRDENYAYGIYSEERPANATLVSLGAEGFVDDGSVFFVAGKYYVKVFDGRPAPGRDELMSFAAQVAAAICDTCQLPHGLSYLPETGKVKSSERFMAENFMGITGFNGVFTARYSDGGQMFRMFVFRADDKRCQGLMDKYFNRMDFKKKLKPKTYHFEDPYLGKVMLSYGEGYIVGMLDAVNPDEHLESYQLLLRQAK